MSDREQELEARVEQLENTVSKMLPSRRQAIKGMGVAGVTGLLGFSAGQASADASTSDSDGNVGLPASPVDVFADGVDATSVSTDDLDIAGNDFVSSGDFIGLWTAGPVQNGVFSTTSTTYTNDPNQILGRAVWDTIIPAGATGSVQAITNINHGTGETIDVRVQNVSDGETITEITGITTSETVEPGPTNYTPTTTASPIQIRFEIRTNPGSNSSSLNQPYITIGAQL